MPYLAAIITVILWGATPAATQIAVADIDAVSVGLLRTLLGGALLGPLALLLRLPLPRSRNCWLALMVSSVTGFIGFSLLFTVGIKLTSTAHAALIIAAAPIFTGFIGFVLDGGWPRRVWWWGAAIAIAGEAVLIGFRHPGGDQATLTGDLVVLVSTIVVSAGYVAGARVSREIGTWSATAWGLALAALVLVPFVLAQTELDVLASAGTDSLVAVLYLAVFSSVAAYACWYWAIGVAGVARIAPIQFLQPVVSLVLAVMLFSEPITWPIVVALVAIVAGIVIGRR